MIISYELWVMSYELLYSYTSLAHFQTSTLSHFHTLLSIHLSGNQVQTAHSQYSVAEHGSFRQF